MFEIINTIALYIGYTIGFIILVAIVWYFLKVLYNWFCVLRGLYRDELEIRSIKKQAKYIENIYSFIAYHNNLEPIIFHGIKHIKNMPEFNDLEMEQRLRLIIDLLEMSYHEQRD